MTSLPCDLFAFSCKKCNIIYSLDNNILFIIIMKLRYEMNLFYLLCTKRLPVSAFLRKGKSKLNHKKAIGRKNVNNNKKR